MDRDNKGISRERIIFRVILDIFLFCSVFLAPWWTTVFVAIIGFFSFGFYLEAVMVALLLDGIYGSNTEKFGGFRLVLFFGMTSLFALTFFLKKNISWYR